MVASALTPLKVAEPYITMTLDLAATEQGKSTSMIAKIETPHAFEGAAAVELLGLPLGATCPALTFTKDQTALTFPITVAAAAKIGKHNGLFCRVKVPAHGTTILHQTAINSTLRIDAPSPAPVAKAECTECHDPHSAANPSQCPPPIALLDASIHCWAGGVSSHWSFAIETQTWSPNIRRSSVAVRLVIPAAFP